MGRAFTHICGVFSSGLWQPIYSFARGDHSPRITQAGGDLRRSQPPAHSMAGHRAQRRWQGQCLSANTGLRSEHFKERNAPEAVRFLLFCFT